LRIFSGKHRQSDGTTVALNQHTIVSIW